MEGRQRRSFTDDYKRQAVDLVASSGRSIGSVAKELGLRAVLTMRRNTFCYCAPRATADGPDDCLTGKSVNSCPAPFAKIFRFAADPNQN